MIIPHNRPLILDEDKKAIAAVLDSGYIGQGPECARLEDVFTKYLGGGNAVALSSGTSAIFLAILGLELGQGSRIAVPSYTCSAILNAVYAAQAQPIIFDICSETHGIDPKLVCAYDGRLDAILTVHNFGVTSNIHKLRERGIPIIEDCCQSLGSIAHDVPHGTMGDVAVFSFYATKIIAGGHGGLVWSRNKKLTDFVKDYRDFDCCIEYKPRFNLQMTDIQSAMVVQQFSRLQKIKVRRQYILKTLLPHIPNNTKLLPRLDDSQIIPYRFILNAGSREKRDQLRQHFREYNVDTIVPIETYELLHRYSGLDPINYPTAENASNCYLSLPLYPGLTESEISIIIKAMNLFAL